MFHESENICRAGFKNVTAYTSTHPSNLKSIKTWLNYFSTSIQNGKLIVASWQLLRLHHRQTKLVGCVTGMCVFDGSSTFGHCITRNIGFRGSIRLQFAESLQEAVAILSRLFTQRQHDCRAHPAQQDIKWSLRVTGAWNCSWIPPHEHELNADLSTWSKFRMSATFM